MDWLIPALASSLASALVLILVYIFLYRQFRQKFLFVWVVGWGFYALRFVFELAQMGVGRNLILAEAALYTTLISGLLQFWGTHLFVNRKMASGWIIGAAAGSLVCQVLAVFTAREEWLTVWVFMVQAVVYIWNGVILIRAKELERISRMVTGGTFLLWGIHKIDYPFLSQMAWFVPWGFLLGAILGWVVALGFILIYFQRLLHEQRLVEGAIRQSSEDLSRLFQKLPVMLVGFDVQDRVVAWNGECERVTGYSRLEIEGRPRIFSRLIPNERERQALFDYAKQSGYSYRNQEWTLKAKDGSERTILWSDLSRENPLPGWKFWLVGLDVTDRKQAEARYATILRTTMDGFWAVDMQGRFQEVNEAACQLIGYTREELLQMRVADIEADEQPDEIERHLTKISEAGGDRFETRFRCKGGRVINAEISVNYFPFVGGTHIVFIRDITARKQVNTSLQERVVELEAVSRVSAALRSASSLDDLLPGMTQEMLVSIQAEVGAILVYDAAQGRIEKSFGSGWTKLVPKELLDVQSGPLAMVLRTGQSYTSSDASQDPRIPEELRPYLPAGWSGIALPLRALSEPVGIFLAFAPCLDVSDQWKMRMVETLTEIVGSAIHQVRLRDRTQRNLNRMAALHEIDATIASSLDLRMTLEILLSQTLNQLGVEATEVLQMNPQLQRLEGLAGRGFRLYRPEHRQVRPGEGLAGRALLDRRLVEFHMKTGSLGQGVSDSFYQTEGICEGYALPLVSKGQIVGVMTVLNRKRMPVDADWIDFFKTLANQAALAIDDIGMVEKLRRSNTELVQSYSRLVDGLSGLIEARLREPEGQNRELADLAIRMAEKLGIPAAEWLSIRQGVLLHDIGLISVPDAVLFKGEPLAEEEWQIFRQHPRVAYDLLSASAPLRQVLDIPYCHHEHWDGSGYPRGLKGDLIPLAARIFAVVEYWQLLQTGQSVRLKAWVERPTQSLAQCSGRQFDPQVVKAFLEMNRR